MLAVASRRAVLLIFFRFLVSLKTPPCSLNWCVQSFRRYPRERRQQNDRVQEEDRGTRNTIEDRA